MGQCNSCRKFVLVELDQNKGNLKNIYPNPLPEPIDERIPETIRRDFEEALKCFSIRAYRASGVMARRALQNCCLDKGAKEKDRLVDQIDWLYEQRVITDDLKQWAHEVRLTGNDAAHPRKPENEIFVSEDDAKDILELLKQFTNILYVAPTIAEERKKSREDKK
jgi:hypothetical protein